MFSAYWSESRECLWARWSPCRAVTEHFALSFQGLFINSFLIGTEITGLVLQASRSQQGGRGDPFSLFPPAHNGCVCKCVLLCDFVIVWVCIVARWDQCFFQLRKHHILQLSSSFWFVSSHPLLSIVCRHPAGQCWLVQISQCCWSNTLLHIDYCWYYDDILWIEKNLEAGSQLACVDMIV